MRFLLFLLLFNSTVSAQPIFFPGDSAAVSTIDLPAHEPFDTARAYLKISSPYIYIISDKDLYDHFGYNVSMRFREFNFTEFHILGVQECRQCVFRCYHAMGKRNCHRNACNREWLWLKRENKKAFATVPSFSVPWFERKELPRYHDTVITTSNDTSSWHTTGHGDCFARFNYAVVADKFYPSLILKEWNHWGGCRAGGSKPATIVYKEPKGILYKTKRTILVEKD